MVLGRGGGIPLDRLSERVKSLNQFHPGFHATEREFAMSREIFLPLAFHGKGLYGSASFP